MPTKEPESTTTEMVVEVIDPTGGVPKWGRSDVIPTFARIVLPNAEIAEPPDGDRIRAFHVRIDGSDVRVEPKMWNSAMSDARGVHGVLCRLGDKNTVYISLQSKEAPTTVHGRGNRANAYADALARRIGLELDAEGMISYAAATKAEVEALSA